jgi:hypothetical protein
MASLQKDVDLTTNVGGDLTHWTGVEETGGELVVYNTRPIGGAPSQEVDVTQRQPYGYTVKTRVVGDDATARATFRAKYAEGQTFDAKATPSDDGDMKITGRAGAIGRRFVITQSVENTSGTTGTEGALTELTITMTELGATPSG